MADGHSTSRGRVEAQLRDFIAALRPSMLKKARKISRNPTDAEDLVQAASMRFLDALTRWRRLPSESELERMFIVTMTYLFISQGRKRTSEKKGRVDPTLEWMTMARPPELERASQEDLDAEYEAALKKLSPLLRSTLELSLKDKSYLEIATQQKISTGAVGKRLSDAREKLRSLLKPFFSHEEH